MCASRLLLLCGSEAHDWVQCARLYSVFCSGPETYLHNTGVLNLTCCAC